MAEQPSFAARLIAFRNELIAGKVPPHVADQMVTDASTLLLDSVPFTVKLPEPEPPTRATVTAEIGDIATAVAETFASTILGAMGLNPNDPVLRREYTTGVGEAAAGAAKALFDALGVNS